MEHVQLWDPWYLLFLIIKFSAACSLTMGCDATSLDQSCFAEQNNRSKTFLWEISFRRRVCFEWVCLLISLAIEYSWLYLC